MSWFGRHDHCGVSGCNEIAHHTVNIVVAPDGPGGGYYSPDYVGKRWRVCRKHRGEPLARLLRDHFGYKVEVPKV